MITDMTMPVMEGPEAIGMLRAINSTLPIGGIRGLAPIFYRPKFAGLGVKGFLPKPNATRELLQTVNRVLEEALPAEKHSVLGTSS